MLATLEPTFPVCSNYFEHAYASLRVIYLAPSWLWKEISLFFFAAFFLMKEWLVYAVRRDRLLGHSSLSPPSWECARTVDARFRETSNRSNFLTHIRVHCDCLFLAWSRNKKLVDLGLILVECGRCTNYHSWRYELFPRDYVKMLTRL